MSDGSTVSSAGNHYDFIFKIVLVGDSGVGKTNLLTRYSQNKFDADTKSTIGVEFATKSERIDEQIIKSQIWDTAGQERFRSLTSAYYRGAGGALLVFDLTNATSFRNCRRWVSDLRENSSTSLTIILVGNKNDLRDIRKVSLSEAKSFAEEESLLYIETSACSGDNVNKAFRSLLTRIYGRVKQNVTTSNLNKKNFKQPAGVLVSKKESREEAKLSCCRVS